MKKHFFTIAALSLCLLTVPSWAMESDKVSLNQATRLPVDPAAPAVATVEDADDDSSSSSSSDSSSSDSEVAQEARTSNQAQNKKSKTFFVHIANQDAARSYAHILQAHNFSVSEHQREHVVNEDIADVEKFLNEGKSVKRLCRVMQSALKKFGATQELVQAVRGKFIKLTTSTEQSVKEVTKHLKKSVFVYQVFSDEAEWMQYRATQSRTAARADLARVLKAALNLKEFDPAQGVEQFVVINSSSTADTASNSAQTGARTSGGNNENGNSVGQDGAASASTANPTTASERMSFTQAFLSSIFARGEDENSGGRDGEGSE